MGLVGVVPSSYGAVLKKPVFFFLLRTALMGSPRHHQLPTANRRQLPNAANRHQPPTTSHQPPPTTSRHQPPTANRQVPPTTNRQSPTANLCSRESPSTREQRASPRTFVSVGVTQVSPRPLSPVLVASPAAPHRPLLPLPPHRQCILRKRLLPEIVREVMDLFRIAKPDMAEVAVLSCSSQNSPSHMYSFDPKCTLEPGTNSCWISASSTLESGRFAEWILYSLGPQRRRVDFVRMMIPMLPAGPLSVRCALAPKTVGVG